MIRNLCIVDCKSFEDYELVVRTCEGLGPDEYVGATREDVEVAIMNERKLFDSGKEKGFYHFWSSYNRGITYAYLTMAEFRRRYTKSSIERLLKAIKDMK